jgi:hypothetical protein
MSQRDDAAYIEHLEAKIKELEQEIGRLRKEKGLSSAGEGLTFNEQTGTHVEAATTKHYCTPCLLKDDKRIPLKYEPHGWRCLICTKYYSDPNRPERPLDYGPNSWMA